jgi:bromodomain-containing factor 1
VIADGVDSHPTAFDTNTNMEATTDSPPYETSNAAAAASNAVGASPVLPVKLGFGVPVETPEEHPLESSLQPVRQVGYTPENTGSSEIAEAQPTGAPLNGASMVADMNENNHHPPEPTPPTQLQSQGLSTQEPALQSSPFTSTSVGSSAPSSLPPDILAPLTTAVAPSEVPTLTGDAPIQAEQAPTSDLRTSLLAEPVSSETALHIKMEKEQKDFAADPKIAQTVAEEVEVSAESGSAPVHPPISTAQDTPQSESQQNEGTAMDTSFDTAPVTETPIASLPTSQPVPAESVLDAPVPSPPAPQPAPANLPTQEPPNPTPTPAQPSSMTETQADHAMLDAPSPSGKVSRERDEEAADDERAAKRTKIEDTTADQDFKVPELPQGTSVTKDESEEPAPTSQSSVTPNGDTAPGVMEESDKITPPRLAHMKKIISNLKKSNTSQWFRAPVDHVAMKIPTYPIIITHPMDLGTIDNKLKSQAYSFVREFVDDFNLIVNNAVTFNGPDHVVAQTAQKMQVSFNNQMSNMPAAVTAEPLKEEKKVQKPKEQPTRTAPPRRQSIPAPSSTTGQPGNMTRTASSGSAQTFALNPEGVPTIRRDSTALDGRPKRAIKPTRNHDIGSARPRKKKYELELRFCKEVLNEIKKPRHWQANQYFLAPVDPVALQIPTYWKVIKKPMDLSTVQTKLDANEYEKAKDFEEDVRQIFKNCFTFNKPGDLVYKSGQDLEKLFNEKWEGMGEWLASRQPNSEPQSAGDDDEEDDESDEDEEDDSDVERQEKIAQLQKQMEAMSKHMSELVQPKKKKKSTPPVVPTKKSSKSKGGKKEKQQATFPALQQKDKKKPAVKTKPEKERYVSYNEKQYISSAITQLDERRMNEALAIIQNNVPNLKNTDQTEIELDIDELPNFVLLKLLTFLKKYVPQAAPEPPSEPAFVPTAPPSKPKKNKPMTKHEQEAQIEELKGKLAGYNGGPVSPNAGKSCRNPEPSDLR